MERGNNNDIVVPTQMRTHRGRGYGRGRRQHRPSEKITAGNQGRVCAAVLANRDMQNRLEYKKQKTLHNHEYYEANASTLHHVQ